jgi:hypothetical protein
MWLYFKMYNTEYLCFIDYTIWYMYNYHRQQSVQEPELLKLTDQFYLFV